MKKFIAFIVSVLALSACGPHLYTTMSGGKDNAAFVVVVTNGAEYENVMVMVDDQSYPVEKVYPLKRIRKAHPIQITPGKHQLKVTAGGQTIVEENIFIGLQETKKIVLK